ncbi:MAG: ABC transporter permease, partial [Candidatus Saccharimonadales bacterium]
DRLPTTGSDTSSMPFAKAGGSGATTSLISPVTLNRDNGGASGGSGGEHFFVSGGSSLPANFSPPIQFLGTTDPSHLDNGGTITIKSGATIDGSKDTNEALVSTAMASKNNLKVGSTFTAYDKTLTIAGIFDSGSQGGNDSVILSLPAEQRLSGQNGVVTNAVATVDSVDNLSSATNAIKGALGSSADITNSQTQVDQEVKPLNSVKTVSFFSLIGAVVAGAIIILLVMVMVVRERKREIGVIKAIGGSNLRIMGEFMIEALTLTVAGAAIGLLIGVVGGQPVTNALVNNSTSSNNTAQGQGPGGRTVSIAGGGAGPVRNFRNSGAVKGLSNINAEIGWGILLDGFGAAILIAIIGSALASCMISKVRPSETLRSE